MANTNLSIVLKTQLEKSGIHTELQQIQKIVNKYHINLVPELKTDGLNEQFMSLCMDMANDFNKTFGSNFTGKEISQLLDSKQILSANAMVNQTDSSHYTGGLSNNGTNPSVYESIDEQSYHITSANEAFNQYNENLTQTNLKTQNFVDTMSASNSSLDDATKKFKKGTSNLKQYGATLVATKVKTAALEAVTETLSSAVSSGVSFLVSKAFTAIDNLIHREERLSEAAETGSENINDAKSNFDDIKRQTEDIAPEFANLSQGVNQTTGKNKSLSAEDYNRYLELSNQLAESLPGVGYTFDENGNKIVNLKGNANDITNNIDDLIQAELAKTNQTIDKNMDDVFKKSFEDLQTYSGDLDQLNSVMTDAESVMDHLLSGKSLSLDLDNQSNLNFYESLKELFQGVGLNLNSEFGQISLDHNAEWAELTDQEIAQLKEGASNISYTFAEQNDEIANSIQSTKEKIQTTLNELAPFLNSWVSTTLDYKSLTEAYGSELGSAIQTSVSAINWANIKGVHDWDDAEDWIQKNILTPLKDVDNQEVRDAYVGLFTTDLSDMPIEEEKKIIDGYMDILYQYLKKDGESKADFKIRFGFDIDALDKQYKQTLKQSLQLEGAEEKDLEKFFTDNSINTAEELTYWNEIVRSIKRVEEAKKKYLETYVNADTGTSTSSFSKAWKNLDTTGNEETKQQLLELAEAGQLTEKAFMGSPIAKQFMKDTGLSAEEATIKINKLVDSAKQLSSMKSGISAITSAYDEKKTNNNYVSYETLESMQNTLEIDDSWSKKDLKVWDEYKNAASDTSMSLNEFKKYQDALATSYVNSGNFLANLTSKNQEYYDGLLKEMGVTNAHEITTKLLADSEKYLGEQKTFATLNGHDLTNATADEIQKFIELQGGADSASTALLKLALDKESCNEHVLDFSGDCSNLLGYVKALGGSTRALQALQAAQNRDWATVKFLGYDPSDTSSISSIEDDAEKEIQKASESQGKTNIATTPGNQSADTKKDTGEKTRTQTKQAFDWVEQKVTSLNTKLDLLKAKLENTFSVKKKNSIIDQEITKTNKLIKTYQKQAKVYKKQAKASAKSTKTVTGEKKNKLSKSLQKKIQNGQINGGRKKLIETYGEKDANAIQEYQDYWDKYQAARTNVQSAKTSRRELKIEKKQNYVDKYDALSAKYDAQMENAATAKAKNALEDKKLASTKKSYNYQIKIADELENDPVKVATLKAEKKKAIRDIQIEQLQNIQDEADGYRDMLDAQMENAATAKAKNAYLTQEVSYINQSYQAQIKAAQLEKNTALVNQLKAEQQKAIRDNQVEQLQNLSDEQAAQYDLNQQLENNANTAAEKNKYEAASRENLKYQYAYEIQIAQKNGDATEAKRLQAELEEQIVESYKKEIENLKEEYNLVIGIRDARRSTIDSQISALQANGYNIAVELYTEQQGSDIENYLSKLEEISDIADKIQNLDPNSQDYKKYNQELETLKQEAWGYQEAWAEAQQAINDINLSKIERIGTLLGYQASQLEYIQNILGHSDFTLSDQETGGLTIEGLSSAAITFRQMANNNEQIANKWDQIHEIERQIKDGERRDIVQASDEINTLKEEMNELENANYDFGDSIKSMLVDSLNSLSDALDENVSKYKDALQAQKDLYDYRKKISNQLKSISSLEKQLAALQGDQSEEARARIQELQLSLEEENDNLEEMEYEKYIQDQEEMLDKVSEDFQDFIANVSDMSVSQICEAMGRAVTDNQEAISETLVKAFEESTAIGNVANSVKGLEEIISKLDFGTKVVTGLDEDGNTSYEYTDDQGNHVKYTTDNLGNMTGMFVNGKEVEIPKSQVLNTNDDINRAILQGIAEHKENIASNGNVVSTVTPATATPATATPTTNKTTTSARTEEQKTIDKYIPGKLKSNNELKYDLDAITGRTKNDPATKYIMGKYNNKMLSYTNEANLGNALAGGQKFIPADFNPKKTKAKKLKENGNFILNKLKKSGFSQGGIASELNKVALENDDDGWVTLQRGESVLTPLQTEQFQKLTENLVPLNVIADNTTALPNYSVPIKRTVDSSTKIGNIDIHLDGSNVIDADSFIQTLHNPKVLKEVSNGVSNQFGTVISNKLSKF